MATIGGMWAPAAMRLIRVAVTKSSKVLRSQIAAATARPVQGELPNVSIRTTATGRQAIHPIALLRQQRRSAKWHSTNAQDSFVTTFRRFMSGGKGGRRFIDRSKFPTSTISRRVAQLPGRAPFACTLRPNLTGGALPRTAGGYSVGGGARYFSHTPAAPAQVVHNVSAAMRAFCFSGHRARFDGVDSTGHAKYRPVSALEDNALRKMSSVPKVTPGSFIDFKLSPTVTALSPLAAAFPFPPATASIRRGTIPAATLNAEGVLDELSTDFARALKDLSIVFSDLKKLAILGDLPILLEKPDTIRIRFPGVDAETVARLCDDMGVERGLIGEDTEFGVAMGVPVALRFPFAPESDAGATVTSPGGSLRSVDSRDMEEAFLEMEGNPWLSEPEGYESLSPESTSADHFSKDFEGLEGIYRFLEVCNDSKGRFQP